MKDEKKSDVHLHAASKNTSDPVRPGGSLFSLAEICETAISSVLKETLQKNMGVSLSIDPSVPNYVKGDAEQLKTYCGQRSRMKWQGLHRDRSSFQR